MYFSFALIIIQTQQMTQILFQIVSATNYTERITNIFHKFSRSVVGWQSTDYAVTPIQVLFKLQQLSFVTQIYLHPKMYKSVKLMEVFISDDNDHSTYESVAKIYDFNDAVRVQISSKCKFMKFKVLQKQHGKAASIDFLRIYGHQYFKNMQKSTLYSSKKQKIQQILIQNGMSQNRKWQVDDETLTTLHDLSKIKDELKLNGENQKLKLILKDFDQVLQIGKKIKQLEHRLKWLDAKQQYEKIKDINDQIKSLRKKRQFYDQKYQTSRFFQMIEIDDTNNKHDQILKGLLEQDKLKLQNQRKRRQQQAIDKQHQIDQQFDKLQQQEEWWNQKHHLQEIQKQQRPKSKKQPKKQDVPIDLKKSKFQFNNPYVYNQGDADMEKYIKPLLSQFGANYLGDPQLLRKYEQMEFLDILGARIWIATHSQNWRQRAAAVQAVLGFAQSELPERYKTGKTRNLFLALMEFARINAQDKVLQIYYTSLKIVSIALAPPICSDDVPASLINKTLQKFLPILIQKISQTNARAKQISLKTLITIFKHPATQINIAINQCLKICKEQLNVKFIPVDKQNPRLIQSRLEIIAKILEDLPKIQKKKVDFDGILKYLIEGSLYHSHNDIRVLGVDVLSKIYKFHKQGTIQWYNAFKSLKGLRPNIESQIQAKLKIH